MFYHRATQKIFTSVEPGSLLILSPAQLERVSNHVELVEYTDEIKIPNENSNAVPTDPPPSYTAAQAAKRGRPPNNPKIQAE
jgi:hypothetical protein